MPRERKKDIYIYIYIIIYVYTGANRIDSGSECVNFHIYSKMVLQIYSYKHKYVYAYTCIYIYTCVLSNIQYTYSLAYVASTKTNS